MSTLVALAVMVAGLAVLTWIIAGRPTGSTNGPGERRRRRDDSGGGGVWVDQDHGSDHGDGGGGGD